MPKTLNSGIGNNVWNIIILQETADYTNFIEKIKGVDDINSSLLENYAIGGSSSVLTRAQLGMHHHK